MVNHAMHEDSIANAILNQVRGHIVNLLSGTVTHPAATQRIASLAISCGELSGVDSSLLLISLERLCSTSREFAGCECHVNPVPVTARCNECHSEFSLVNFNFQCSCGSQSLEITSGDSLILESFTLTDDSRPTTV